MRLDSLLGLIFRGCTLCSMSWSQKNQDPDRWKQPEGHEQVGDHYVSHRELFQVSKEVKTSMPHPRHRELVLMDLDPYRMYAYWYMDEQHLRRSLSPRPLPLRRLVLSVIPISSAGVSYPSVEWAVKGLQNSRYIEAPGEHRVYRVALGFRNEKGDFERLALSNLATLPPPGPSSFETPSAPEPGRSAKIDKTRPMPSQDATSGALASSSESKPGPVGRTAYPLIRCEPDEWSNPIEPPPLPAYQHHVAKKQGLTSSWGVCQPGFFRRPNHEKDVASIRSDEGEQICTPKEVQEDSIRYHEGRNSE